MRKLITTATLTALALSGLAAASTASAAGPASTTVRASGLNTAETRTAGHVVFLRNGLHVYTDDATSQAKAAGYFDIGTDFPASASMKWVGTQPEPGKQLVFDVDGITGNGNDYNILVGEPVYGNVWWLTPSSSAAAKAVDPSGANNGGQGSEWFGTLADWKLSMPNARALAGGFSLGSGVKGDGVIERMQYDSNIFEFTSVPEAQDGSDGATGPQGPVGATGPQGPAAPAATTAPTGVAGSGGSGASAAQDVTGTVTGKVKPRKVKPRKVKLVFATDKLASGAVQGKALIWKVKVDGALASRFVQRAGERDVWIRPFGAGKHVVQVTNNAGKMQNFKLTVR